MPTINPLITPTRAWIAKSSLGLAISMYALMPFAAEAHNTTTINTTGPESTTTVTNTSTTTATITETTTSSNNTSYTLNLSAGVGSVRHNTTANITGGDVDVALANKTEQNSGTGSAFHLATAPTDPTNTTTISNTGPGATTAVSNTSTQTISASNTKSATSNTAFNVRADTSVGDVSFNTNATVREGTIRVAINSETRQNTTPLTPPGTPPVTHPSTPGVPDQSARGGGIDMPIMTVARPVTATLASVSSNAIPLSTLSAATPAKQFFPAGATNNSMFYILLFLLSFAIIHSFQPRRRLAASGSITSGRYIRAERHAPLNVKNKASNKLSLNPRSR